MSLKPPSIGRLFSSNVLYITIVEVAAMREVDLDGHWRFFSQLYKRVVASQSCYTVVAGITGIIQWNTCYQWTTLTESDKQNEFNTDKKTE